MSCVLSFLLCDKFVYLDTVAVGMTYDLLILLYHLLSNINR